MIANYNSPKHTTIRYGTRQEECNKSAATALISMAYRAPCLSLRAYPSVCATLPKSVPSCKAPQSLIAVLFQGLRRFSPNYGTFGKKCHNTVFCACCTNPEENHKSAHVSYQNVCTNFYKLVAFFLTRTVVYMYVS